MKKGKGLVSVSGGRYADAILGGILWLLLVRLLTQRGFGLVTYWLSISTVLTSVSSLGFRSSFKTFVPKGEEGILEEGNLLTFLPIIALTFGLAFYVPPNFLGLPLYLFFFNRYQLSINEMLGKRKYHEFLVCVVGKRLVQIFASFSLFYLIGINGVFVGLALGLAVSSYRSFISLLSFSQSLKFPLTRVHSSFILYSFARVALAGVLAPLDRIFIGRIYDYSILGVYGFIARMFSLLCILPRSFKGYLLPERAADKQVEWAELIGIGASVGIGLLVFLFTPFGLHWLFPKYTEAVNALRILSITPVIVIFSTILSARFLSNEDSRTPFIAKMLGQIVKISTVIFLYRFFGVLGLGITFILVTFTTLSFLLLMQRSTTFISFPFFKSLRIRNILLDVFVHNECPSAKFLCNDRVGK